MTLRTASLKRFARTVKSRSGEVEKAFIQWSRLYGAFIRTRFVKFSGGGGNWKRLAASTIKARRGKKRGVKILRDTGLLFLNLNPQITGSVITRKTPFGLQATFGGRGTYPDGTTTSDVMSFHNAGLGVPKRVILVAPDRNTTRRMIEVMQRALDREAKK